MLSRVSVIIPALNEAASIAQVVRSVLAFDVAECIVVDNGSTDHTARVAAGAGARVLTSARGFGAAMAAGTLHAVTTSDILVYCDGDGADVIEDLPKLVEPISLDEADFVLGSRLRGQREPGSMLASQVLAGHLIGRLVRLFYGFRYTDMGPFRAIRRSSVTAMQMREMTYGWNLEMQIKAVRRRLRIFEIPVNYRCRAGGTSKVSGDFRASLRAALRIIAVLLRTRR